MFFTSPDRTHRPGPTVATRTFRVLAGARRIPVTLTALGLMIGMGVATGTLWRPADADHGLLRALSFGVPSIQDGHLWTFLTGAFVLPRPEFYLLVGALLVIGLGGFERRVGAARSAAVLFGTQLIGTGLAAVVLWPLDNRSWAWAATLADQVDLGLSAGALGILGAATALLRPTLRRRVRGAVAVYLIVLVFKSGLLWDVEHLLSFAAGVLAGPWAVGRRPEPLRSRLHPVTARLAVSIVIVAVAAANLVESIYPGLGGPFGAGHAMHAPMRGLPLIAGELLVVLLVADSLRRGRAAAWWLAAAGSAAILLDSVLAGRGPARWSDAIFAALVFGLLIRYRNAWRWRTPDGFARACLRRVAVTVGGFAGVWLTVLALIPNQVRPAATPLLSGRELLSRITFNPGPLHPTGPLAHVLFTLLGVAWAVTLLVVLVPWLYADRGPESSAREALSQLLRIHGGGSLGWMRTWPAFSSWTTRDGAVAISYCVVGTVAIAIGDPVGDQDAFAGAVREFRQFCRFAGWTPCWFAATSDLVERAPGLRSTQIGEDTVMDLTTLEFVGKSWQDVRTARNRAEREGIRIVTGRLADYPADLRARVEAISREWVSAKSLPEMGFTLGTVGHALDPEMRTHIALDAGGEVHGVTTWLPMYAGGAVVGWTLDVMRRRPEGFRPVMEYLIAESAMAFKAEGYRTLSLSVAPLARRTPLTGRPTMIDRSLDVMSKVLEPAYGFRSLLAFKAKFHPEFQPVYLVYQGPAELLTISLAIGHAYLPHLSTRQATQLMRGMRRGHAAAPAKELVAA